MKKSFKNRMKGALALVCLLWGMTTGIPIQAEGETSTSTQTVTLTVDGVEGHTFAAYQIFTGTFESIEEGETSTTVFKDLQWGTGVNSENLITKLKEENILSSDVQDPTAQDVARAIETYTKEDDDSSKAKEISTLIHTCLTSDSTPITIPENSKEASVNLAPGYYLIVDTTEPAEGSNFTWNASLLQLTDNMEIKAKTSTPMVTKKVYDNDTLNFQDVADHSVGDSVQFKVSSNIPDTTHFSKYTYVFHDTLSEGLTLLEDVDHPITVKLDDQPIDQTLFPYTVDKNPSHNGCSFHITFENLKGADGKALEIQYYAQLDKDKATIGIPSDGKQNTNAVKLEYSNHPYDENSFATTPEDKVLVLTYKLVGSKRDAKEENGEHKALEGAQFYLLNTKQENEANPIYAKVENGKFAGWTTKSNATILESKGENGGFEIQGLDAGTYYLKEIKAPVGYNIMEGLQPVEVIANKSEVYDFASSTSPIISESDTTTDSSNSPTSKISVDSEGKVEVTVFNGKGFTMPSTGAFGQTLIYGVGGLLALGGLGIRMARRRHEQD